MQYRETPLSFDCRGASLLGVLDVPATAPRTGVVIVVGGPQYRVGSHRQFVLLSRSLAVAGIACLRFDYRGMGDSEGVVVSFDATQPDIAAAVAALRLQLPDLEHVVLWGLCDAACGCAFAAADLGVSGMVLVNPWVRTENAAEEATLKHYYVRRFLDRRFWRKLAAGDVDVAGSTRALATTLRRVLRASVTGGDAGDGALPARVARGIAACSGPVLVVLSANDQTAAEFRVAAQGARPLRRAMERSDLTQIEVRGADHTFSTAAWRDEVAAITISWLSTHFPRCAPGIP